MSEIYDPGKAEQEKEEAKRIVGKYIDGEGRTKYDSSDAMKVTREMADWEDEERTKLPETTAEHHDDTVNIAMPRAIHEAEFNQGGRANFDTLTNPHISDELAIEQLLKARRMSEKVREAYDERGVSLEAQLRAKDAEIADLKARLGEAE